MISQTRLLQKPQQQKALPLLCLQTTPTCRGKKTSCFDLGRIFGATFQNARPCRPAAPCTHAQKGGPERREQWKDTPKTLPRAAQDASSPSEQAWVWIKVGGRECCARSTQCCDGARQKRMQGARETNLIKRVDFKVRPCIVVAPLSFLIA